MGAASNSPATPRTAHTQAGPSSDSRKRGYRSAGRHWLYINALGTVTPVYTVTVTSRLVGELKEIHYREGQIVDVAERGASGGDQCSANLPAPALPMPPIYSKTNPADAPILTLALTSNSMALQGVENYADTRLAQKISQLAGVGAVTISGGKTLLSGYRRIQLSSPLTD